MNIRGSQIGKSVVNPLRRVDSKSRLRAPLSSLQNLAAPQNDQVDSSNVQQPIPPPTFSFVEFQVGDPSDPMQVSEYESSIYKYLRQKELLKPPLQFRQTDVTMKDRNLLVNTLCRIHYKFGHTTNGLYICIGILDIFLSSCVISKKALKTYGCAAYLIASKIEDIYPASINELCTFAEKAFTVQELLAAERAILNELKFDLTFGTPLFFLTQFIRVSGQTREMQYYSRYVLEVLQTSDNFFGMFPSKMAATVILTTRRCFDQELWTSDLAGYTQYSLVDLIEPFKHVREILLDNGREESKFIYKKYAMKIFLGVSMLPVPRELPSDL